MQGVGQQKGVCWHPWFVHKRRGMRAQSRIAVGGVLAPLACKQGRGGEGAGGARWEGSLASTQGGSRWKRWGEEERREEGAKRRGKGTRG